MSTAKLRHRFGARSQKLLLFIVISSGSLGLALLFPLTALAGFGSPAQGIGYFSGQNVNEHNANDVIYDGGNLDTVTTGNKAAFINTIESIQKGPYEQGYTSFSGERHYAGWALGADFIIQTMRGGTDMGLPTSADIQDWEDRVNNPDVDLIVGSYSTPGPNSGYQHTSVKTRDGKTNLPGDVYWLTEPQSGTVISFVKHSDHSVVYYRIRVACGNPVGTINPLPNSSSWSSSGTTSVAGGTWVSPNSIRFTNTVTITKSGSSSVSYTPSVWGHWFSNNAKQTNNDHTGFSNLTTGSARSTNYSYSNNVAGSAGHVGDYYCEYVHWTPKSSSSSAAASSDVVCKRLYATPPPPPPPTTGYYCTNSTDFNIDKLVLTGSFTVSGRNSSNKVPADDTFQVTVWWQGSSGGSPSAVATLTVPNVSGGTPPTDVTSAPINYKAINATRVGYYYITWTYAGHGPGGSGGACQSATSLLSYHPYFSVLGGDISVGPGFGTSCSANTSAIIKGWNLGSGYSYAGAGANLAAFALGRITGFATAQGGSTGAPGSPGAPSQLAFANTTASGKAPTSTYGGQWGASNSCVPDYVAAASAQTIATGAPDYTTPGTRIYKLSGNQTLGAITVGPGVHVTLVVTGDVYISQPITYGAFGGSVDNIPEFQLLVNGNIYIDSNVGALYGFYDAQPVSSGSPTGGELHTCATGLAAATSDYDTCNQQLTIYGAVAAAKIYLERSYGTLSDGPLDGAPVDAAEKLVFTPELWLTAGQSPTAGNALDDWLSTTSLPPVL